MCKRVRVPAGAREWFTDRQLSGWPEGIQYSPRPTKFSERRRPLLPIEAYQPMPVVQPKPVAGGVTIL